MEEATKRWKTFNRYHNYNFIEARFPSLMIPFENMDQSKFDWILEGLRTNSIPVTEIKYDGLGKVTDDNWTRLYQLMEALEQNNTVISLTISCSCITDEGSEPFFSKLAAPECKIQDLFVYFPVTEKRAVLFKKALKKNTSVQKLHLSSNPAPIIDLFKTNATITSLKISSTTLDTRCAEAFKHNRTLEQITLSKCSDTDANVLHELGEALASIGTLQSLIFELSAGIKHWSLAPIAAVVRGNPKLTHLGIVSDTNFVHSFTEADALGQALARQDALRSLNLCYGAVPALRALKNTSHLEDLTVPVSTPIMLGWFSEVVTSMRGLRRVEFTELNFKQRLYIDLAKLITAESRVTLWRFKYPIWLKPEVFEVLKHRAIRPCCIELLDTYQGQLVEFSEVTVHNPFLEVKFPQVSYRHLFTIQEVQAIQLTEQTTRSKKRSMLFQFNHLYQFLATVMPMKDEHLFSILPDEVLLKICEYVCDNVISSKKLLRAIRLASDREFMLRSDSESNTNVPLMVRFWQENDL